jgi:hypothetical protein
MSEALWTALGAAGAAAGETRILTHFERDPERFALFSVRLGDMLLDFSKTALDARALTLLIELAESRGVPARRDAMFRGEPINVTEGRAVLHTALRNRANTPVLVADFFSCEAAMVSTYLQFLRSHPNYVRLAEEIRLHDPELYRQGTITQLAHTECRLRRGIGRGDLAPMGDAEITIQAYFIIGTLTFLDRMMESDSYPGDAAVTATYISFLRTGLNPCGALQQVSHGH